jgi:quercetin 2,3-dioxygenase
VSIDLNQASPYHLGANSGVDHMEAMGVEMRWLARSSDTGGLITLVQYKAPAGFGGPGLHVHTGEDEFFYVLRGTLKLQIGDSGIDLGEGGFAWGPRNVPHSFANHTDDEAVFLFGLTPGGLEAMFAEMFSYLNDAGADMDPAELVAINQRHGVATVGPPIARS